MSIAAMSHVWSHSQHKGNHLVLMLAIADYANERGVAWPAIKTLAQRLRVDDRTAQRCLKQLLASGELKIHAGAGPRGCHLYQIVMQETLSLFADAEGVAVLPPGKLPRVAKSPKRGDTAMPPDPSRTVIKTHSGEQQPSPVTRCSEAYRQGIKKRYGADYPTSAKLNGIMANLVKELGAEPALAVVTAYVADSLPWYVQKSHALEYLKRDAGQIWIRLQQRTGMAAPTAATVAKVAILGPDAEVLRRLQDYPPGNAQAIAKQAMNEHTRLLAGLDKARYVHVRQGDAAARFSIAELRA